MDSLLPFNSISHTFITDTKLKSTKESLEYLWRDKEGRNLEYWLFTNLVVDLETNLEGRFLPGAGERHSTRDKGHEEGGSAYAKAGSSLGSAPGYSWASTPPKKPESDYFIALCSHLWLYWGLSPTTISLSLSKS